MPLLFVFGIVRIGRCNAGRGFGNPKRDLRIISQRKSKPKPLTFMSSNFARKLPLRVGPLMRLASLMEVVCRTTRLSKTRWLLLSSLIDTLSSIGLGAHVVSHLSRSCHCCRDLTKAEPEASANAVFVARVRWRLELGGHLQLAFQLNVLDKEALDGGGGRRARLGHMLSLDLCPSRESLGRNPTPSQRIVLG